jgi:hypothetical protein
MDEFDAIKIRFKPEHLLRLMPFKAVADIRYYLNGIHVKKAERGGVYLVATDGHTMALIHDEEGSIEGADEATFTVLPVLVAGAKASQKKPNTGLGFRVCVEGNRAKIAIPDTSMELALQPGKCFIVGKFPDWRKVVPDFSKLKHGVCTSSFNANYLARFAKIVSPKFTGVTFWQEDEHKVLVVQMTSIPEMIGLVMPMRGDGGSLNSFKRFGYVEPLADAPLPEKQPSDADPVAA